MGAVVSDTKGLAMLRGRMAAMGAAGALVVSLSACSAGQSPNTAAVVDGHRITTTQVSETTRAYNQIAGRMAAQQGQQAQALPESVILNALMRGEGASAVARRAGQSVDNNADTMLMSDPDYAPFVADPKTKALFQSLARADVLSKALGEEEFEAALAQVKTTVNPRYGLTGLEPIQRDPATGQPVTKSGSLSNLAAPPA